MISGGFILYQVGSSISRPTKDSYQVQRPLYLIVDKTEGLKSGE